MICFKCGVTGHEEDKCPQSRADDNQVIEQVNNQLRHASLQEHLCDRRPEEEETFGTWMQVKKLVRRRNLRPEKGSSITSKNGTGWNKSTTNPGQQPEQATRTNTGENPGVEGGVVHDFLFLKIKRITQ